MADVVKFTNAYSDISRFAKGKVVSSSLGDVSVAVIHVPRKGFVKEVFLEVIDPFDGTTGAVTVGYEAVDKADTPAGFMANATATPLVAGMKSSYLGQYFEKGGVITVSFAKGDATADANVRVFAAIATIY